MLGPYCHDKASLELMGDGTRCGSIIIFVARGRMD